MTLPGEARMRVWLWLAMACGGAPSAPESAPDDAPQAVEEPSAETPRRLSRIRVDHIRRLGSPQTSEDDEVEEEDERERGRRRRRGRRTKEMTPAFESFATAVDQEIQPHVVGDPRDGEQASPELSGAQAAVAAQLAALGYVDGLVEAASDRVDGVTMHRPDSVWPGYNLFTPAGKNVAYLFDMDGAQVHRWAIELTDIWPSFSAPGDANAESFRRAELMPNGDLIVIWSGYAVARITKDSRVVWAHFLPVHHDLAVDADGRVIVLTRVVHKRPEYDPEESIVEDFITWLGPDGAVVNSFSVLDAFETYDAWEEVWEDRPKQDRDLFHTNALFVLEEDYTDLHPAFRKGRILTSMRHLEVIALIDPDSREVVWHHEGEFSRQHDPQIVRRGEQVRLMIFDNQGGEGETSRILEYDIASHQLTWTWAATPPYLFDTNVCGHAQRLPNGNTLVNESVRGRAFEIGANNKIVWEWRSSHRATTRRLVARNNEFTRYSPLYVSWLTP